MKICYDSFPRLCPNFRTTIGRVTFLFSSPPTSASVRCKRIVTVSHEFTCCNSATEKAGSWKRDRCANAVVQVLRVPVDARADPSDRWVRGRTYQARFEAAYRPAPSCRPGPSDGAPLDDVASRPCGAPGDGDGARVRRPPCAGEACGANRSSFRGAASDGGSAKRRWDGALR